MLIRRKIPWTSQPQRLVAIDPYWVKRGLKAFYVLNSSLWRINLVTGRMSGSAVGTGHSFYGDKIRTSGASTDYINLGLDGFSAVAPFTIIVGVRHISGVVDWSLIRRDVAIWHGIYGENTSIKTSENNSFDGTITPVSGISQNPTDNFSVTLAGANNLRGCVNGGAIATDTTVTVPTGGGLTNVSLGASVFGGGVPVGNLAVADFTYFGIFDGALTDVELQLLSRNPWQVFAPQDRKVFVSVASSDLNITTTLATANASGFTANIDRQLVIATSLGTATASGFTANVDRQLSITTTLATATASGFTANISSDLNVTATLATATASAFSANVDRQLSITATLATANASGSTANVDRQLFITTTLATATASGFDASIALGGGLNITATRAVATASGFVASVTISTPQGSGWETYVAPTRKKTVKQFKEEFNNLTYFELEEKEDEVKSEIRLVEQDIRLNEDLGLDNLIVKLKLALKIQKAKLQAIKSVKQEKIQEAQVQQIQHEAIPIEYTQDIDIIHEDENIDADLSYIAAILRMKYFN